MTNEDIIYKKAYKEAEKDFLAIIKDRVDFTERSVRELLYTLKKIVEISDSDFIEMVASPVIYKYDLFMSMNDNISTGIENNINKD